MGGSGRSAGLLVGPAPANRFCRAGMGVLLGVVYCLSSLFGTVFDSHPPSLFGLGWWLYLPFCLRAGGCIYLDSLYLDGGCTYHLVWGQVAVSTSVWLASLGVK